METLIATIVITLVVMLLTCGVLACFYLTGRRRARCACAAARQVMNQVEARKKSAKDAKKYSVETVDTNALPIVSETVADHLRGK